MSTQLDFAQPPYISQVVVVVDHKPDDTVRKRVGDAEDSFRSVVDAEAKSTNVDASRPADVPRLVMEDGRKQIFIANSRVQLQLGFEKGFAISKSVEIVRKHVEEFLRGVQRFQRRVDAKTFVGVVVHLNQPLDATPQQVAEYFAERFYKGPVIGSYFSLDLTVGFETADALFQNVGFRGYELKRFHQEVKGPGPTEITVNVADLPTAERGLGVSLDVNNRPRAAKGGGSYENTVADVLRTSSALLATHLKSFIPEIKV